MFKRKYLIFLVLLYCILSFINIQVANSFAVIIIAIYCYYLNIVNIACLKKINDLSTEIITLTNNINNANLKVNMTMNNVSKRFSKVDDSLRKTIKHNDKLWKIKK